MNPVENTIPVPERLLLLDLELDPSEKILKLGAVLGSEILRVGGDEIGQAGSAGRLCSRA